MASWMTWYTLYRLGQSFYYERKIDSRRLMFRVPINWICPDMSFQTHLHPLNWKVENHDPSTKNMFSEHMASELLLLNGCDVIKTVTFNKNHAWHSSFVCLISSKGNLSIPLNNLSFQVFQKYQIIQWYGSLSRSGSSILFFFPTDSPYWHKHSMLGICLDSTVSLIKTMHIRPVDTQKWHELLTHHGPYI